MSPATRYYAACCQTDFANPTTRRDIPARVDRMLELIDSAVIGYEPFFPVRLVVFPERARRRGHHMLFHLRTELYSGYSRPIYPRGAEELQHTIEENNRLIEKAKAGGPLPPRRQ